jgi:hypothetical protein
MNSRADSALIGDFYRVKIDQAARSVEAHAKSASAREKLGEIDSGIPMEGRDLTRWTLRDRLLG